MNTRTTASPGVPPAVVSLTPAASLEVPVIRDQPYTLTTGGQACELAPSGGLPGDGVTVAVNNSGEDAVTFAGGVAVFGGPAPVSASWRVTIFRNALGTYDAVIAEPDA